MYWFLAVSAVSVTGSAATLQFGYFRWILLFSLNFLGFRVGLCIREASRYSKATTLRFYKHLFLCIHSDFLLLFIGDSMIGITIGYYLENPLLGGLAGGAWWIFDWYLISLKLLGLSRSS